VAKTAKNKTLRPVVDRIDGRDALAQGREGARLFELGAEERTSPLSVLIS
jgi:hypothetical protein